ncbi:hypothetical protein BDY21DRAFT_258170, partial [Lineolata rhizophorae]
VSIGVSGWLLHPSDVTAPWRPISASTTEPFALRWELDALLHLGTSLASVLRSRAWRAAQMELAQQVLLRSAAAALWPVTLVSAASSWLDNPFGVARARADKAGLVLADALAREKVQGARPVSLVGYSLGARVVFACLSELARQRCFGVVENAVLMGAAAPAEPGAWRRARSVVAGRLVNAWSGNDGVLAVVHRGTSPGKVWAGIAGLRAITGVRGVENVDVSDLVSGHAKYR